MSNNFNLSQLADKANSTGNLNSVTVGATTASAGAFTNLAYTGTLTGGTGVVNLGSGQFYIDTSGNVGIGTSSPSTYNKLAVINGAITSGTATSTSGSILLQGYYNNGAVANIGTEFSNGGPVIGYAVTPSTSASGAFVSSSSANLFKGAYTIAGNSHLWYGGAASATAVGSAVTTSELMRIDSSGNLLVGTTSASYSSAGRGNINIGGSSGAICGFQIGGVAKGYIFHSGTDFQMWNETATPIIFGTNALERMRIDSSGNVGIGTSSPSTQLQVNKATAGDSFSWTNGGSTPKAGYLYSDANIAAIFNTAGAGAGRNGMQLAPTYISFDISASEAMRIDSSGNVLIGTSSSAGGKTTSVFAGGSSTVTNYAYVGGSATYQMIGLSEDSANNVFAITNRYSSGGVIAFRTGTGGTIAEQMRIDSSGNLLVGRTSSINNAGKLQVTATATSSVADFSINSTTGSQNAIDITNTANNAYYAFRFWQNGYGVTASGSIFCNGSATTYNTTSDYRLKTVIGSVTDSGTRIDALQPIEYDWNTGGRTRGFLAHKFAEVYPSSVNGEKDAIDEEGKPVYQAMQASSSEVMADLIAEIQSLRKRLTALESK